jgi:peptide/nickel transport system substrate-binding protein
VNDIKFKILKKEYSLPKSEEVTKVVRSFSYTSKVIFFLLVALFVTSGLYLVWRVSEAYLVEVPIQGGGITEGVVGLPRFINPLIVVTDPSKDITSLVYAGLMKRLSDGSVIPELAESYVVSEDGRVYTFTLKEKLSFHDGTPVTTEDVEFTIQKILDPTIKSPERAAWQGITVEKIDERNIQFTLKQPFPAFLENATIGILPKHIWSNVTGDEFTFSKFNDDAIGAGPYKIKKIKTNAGGIPTSYTLVAFKDYAGEKPLIQKITIRFYSNENKLVEAYLNGEIDSISSVSPEVAKTLSERGARIERAILPRVFGVYFNHNRQSLFLNKEVKAALQEATPKEDIINEVFYGYAQPIDTPLPNTIQEIESGRLESKISSARSILEENGWRLSDEGVYEKKINNVNTTLSFALSTGDTPELKRTAELLKEAWERIGARVDIKVFETGMLNQSVIRPREFDALLFGQIVQRDSDLYAFWHSSQRSDPGLNIAQYSR